MVVYKKNEFMFLCSDGSIIRSGPVSRGLSFQYKSWRQMLSFITTSRLLDDQSWWNTCLEIPSVCHITPHPYNK